ncbi:MAG: hypothetical protein R2751_11075 [Bacteroidales bacterium]
MKEHHVGLLYTIIIHLVVAIVLVFAEVKQLQDRSELGIELEFEEKTVEERVEEETVDVPADWLEQVLARREMASNRAVNRNAEEKLQEEISTREYVNDLLGQIEDARNDADRERLEELQAILAAADYVPPPPEDQEEEESTFSGPTTITYEFLEAPKQRGKSQLTIPVYRCQGSGMVRVEIRVGRDGFVRDAKVLEPIEGMDRNCFAQAAMEAALSSRFRVDMQAPENHRALLTYTFVAQ